MFFDFSFFTLKFFKYLAFFEFFEPMNHEILIFFNFGPEEFEKNLFHKFFNTFSIFLILIVF
jgi:hypothetical protein